MPIPQHDISVLIPTYRYADKIVRAVRSALDSGAGEVVVLDDHSRDGTLERLSAFSDPRLNLVENPQRLGLWENHLNALTFATRPWVKFLQADDWLQPGGLAAFARAADPGVTVVWGAPILFDEAAGAETLVYTLARPRRLDGAALLTACLFHGWLLGSPSQMMLRADAVTRDPEAWRSGVSADLIVGAIAAAQGETALLPPGAIAQAVHAGQDARTQSALSSLTRLGASLRYLRRRPEPELRRFADQWAALQLPGATRTLLRGLVRGEGGRVAQLHAYAGLLTGRS